ncbi:hypothetical protein SD427_11080 [Chryseobacterium sp. JJR-5R]|uniref:hypothetical protein n=1 Tax=Chryseobacterium sp. JJR-5R TaxID=3093923 RepID=UPI002A762E34|nr:hypothetical protein [Chryseobacterium sp. JJR-5R]WPO81306.1 hypothetical protein SD427_11080 [Chryseobacterium sp. JJR-5R]
MRTEDYKQLINDRIEYFDKDKFYLNNKNGLVKSYTVNNGIIIQEVAGEDGGWFVSCTTRSGSCFSVYKEYSHQAIIKKKHVVLRNGGAIVGIKYEFDINGRLIKKTDMDKHYVVTPQDIIKFCEEKGIDILSNNTRIDRNYNEDSIGKYVIYHSGEYDGKFGSVIITEINGTTGDVEKVICK